jgi:hypothetical protein
MEAAAPCEEGGGLHAWASSLKDRRVRRGGRAAGFVHMRRKPRGRASPHSWPLQDKVGLRMSGGEPHASVSCDVDSGDRDPCRRGCCVAALDRQRTIGLGNQASAQGLALPIRSRCMHHAATLYRCRSARDASVCATALLTPALDCHEGGPPRWQAPLVIENQPRGGPFTCCMLDLI